MNEKHSIASSGPSSQGYGSGGGYPPAASAAPQPGGMYPAPMPQQGGGYQAGVGYPPAPGQQPTQQQMPPGYPAAQQPQQQMPPGYPAAQQPQQQMPPGYPAAQQQVQGYPPSVPGGGYPPTTTEGYQTRSQAPPPVAPGPAGAAGTGYTQPPPPAGKYAVPPAGQAAGEASNASAPPMEKMEDISGYSGNNFDTDAYIPPPSYEEATRPPERRSDQSFRMPIINEDIARKALLNEVGKHCCWGKGPAESLRFLDLKSTSAIHYTLESFTEGRTTKWTHEPYLGQNVDSPAYGPAPLPWDIQVKAPVMFVSNVQKCEIPHTASLKPCHTCYGMGRKSCMSCNGNGWDRCHPCNGTGKRPGHGHHHNNHNHGNHGNHHHHHGAGHNNDDCSFCHGRGRKNCGPCHGNGTIQCPTCQGRAQLKCYIQLTVTWTNRFEDFVADKTKLPIELLRRVNGEIAFQEEYPRVGPLTNYPEPKVNNASVELIRKHSTAYSAERILMQRHKVRIIPITECVYKYSDKDGDYLVYGSENEVYIKDYPSTCCGCCVIL